VNANIKQKREINCTVCIAMSGYAVYILFCLAASSYWMLCCVIQRNILS